MTQPISPTHPQTRPHRVFWLRTNIRGFTLFHWDITTELRGNRSRTRESADETHTRLQKGQVASYKHVVWGPSARARYYRFRLPCTT